MTRDYTHLFVDANGRGEEQLQAIQLPDYDPAVYAVGDMFGVAGFFRYDDGWRYLNDGPGSTVDREHLMSEEDWRSWDIEIGTTAGLVVRLLDEAKAKPWPAS